MAMFTGVETDGIPDNRCYWDCLASERIGRGTAMPLAHMYGQQTYFTSQSLGPNLSRDN